MRFGDKQLTALYKAARVISSQLGLPRGFEGDVMKDLRKAISKMEVEIARRAAACSKKKEP